MSLLKFICPIFYALVLCLIELFSIKIEIVYSLYFKYRKVLSKAGLHVINSVYCCCFHHTTDAHEQMSHGVSNKNFYNDAREIFNARK